MYTKFKDGYQDKYPIWENIILINAKTPEEATEKASNRGKADEGDDSGTYRYEDRPAEWVFAGVRKIIACEDPDDRPSDGTEVSYSELIVVDEKELSKLVNGESTNLTYEQ